MSHSRRRDVLKAAGTVVVVGGLAGCAQQEDNGGEEEEDTMQATAQEGQPSSFRAVHASPDAPNVDILVDGEPAVEDLGYGEVSPYVEVEPGTYQVQVTATGDPETVVFEEEVEVQEGVTKTAVAYGVTTGGPDDGFQVDVLEDDLADPGEEMSRVRLFHASPDAGVINVVATQAPGGGNGPPDEMQQPEEGQGGQQQGNVVFQQLGFGEVDTQEIQAGEYTLGVVPAGDGGGGGGQQNGPPEDGGQQDGQPENGGQQQDGQPENGGQQQDGQPEDGGQQQGQQPVAEFDLTTEPQTVYSAFAIGYVNPDEAEIENPPEFEVVVTEDAQGGEQADGSAGGDEMASLSH